MQLETQVAMKQICVFSILVMTMFSGFAQERFAWRSGPLTLWFEVMADSHEVRLTHAVKAWPYYDGHRPKGRVEIPSAVAWRGTARQVVEVGSNAFYRCDSLTEVVLPQGCRSIGSQAFCGCERLCRVEWNHSLSSIGEGAFAYCKSLQEVVLPLGVSRIGLSAFSMCHRLERVEMSEAAWQTCNGYTFHGCERVKIRKIGKKGEE